MGGIDFGQFGSKERQEFNPNRIRDLKERLEGSAVEFLEFVLPGGKVKGKEYIVGTLEGGDGRSTSISLAHAKVGVGSDFATGEKTGDLIDVYCKARGVSIKEALPQIEAWVGMPTIRDAVEKPQIVSSLLPVGFDIHSVPKSQLTTYTYKDYDLNTILTITKVAHSNGKKDFYPEFPDGSKTIPEDYVRPLYNLPNINNADTVIIVEGEKCADYLNSLGLVATTNIGGASAPPGKTDWKPLEGKVCVLWPDNDDAGVKHQNRTLDHLSKMDVLKIRMVKPPKDADEKWDAADCDPKLVKKLLSSSRVAYRPIDIMADEFLAKSYDEHPPEREFLISGGFALNSASILAAEGGTGKSFMFLDLAIKIAYGTIYSDTSFGGQIQQNGNVVYFSAEDGRPDIHERINLVDIGNPPRRFRNTPYDLRIIPMPSLGVTFPLFYMKDGQLTESEQWTRMRESILAMSDVKLIIFDPLSMLVHADVNADPSMGSIVMAEFNRLAVETNSSVLISHHFSKGNYDVAIDSPEQARQHVRGTTALVDSARNVFCVWRASESQAKESCLKVGMEYERNKIFMGATVKSNYLTQDALKVFRRDPFTGVLTCIETNYDSAKVNDSKDDMERIGIEIKRVIAQRAFKGIPIRQAGYGSMLDTDLDQPIRNLLAGKGKEAIKTAIQKMIDRKEVVISHKLKRELDVTGGTLHEIWKKSGDI